MGNDNDENKVMIIILLNYYWHYRYDKITIYN